MPPRKQQAQAAAPGLKPVTPMPPAVESASDADFSRLIHGAAAATLVYGDTGSGKTTLVATFAKWVWKKFHVPTRLIAADPGGYSDDILALIKLGIVEVWRIYTRDPLGLLGLPSETIQRAAQGWWPAEIDPASGACPLGVQLVPPPPVARFAIAFDSLIGMQDWSMVDMGARSAQGTLGGEGANMKTVVSGDMKMGVGNRASVGFTQGKGRDWVLSSLSIPNLVFPPVFTSLELKILDSETKLPLYGPKLAGQAKTGEAPAWFGATIGTCLAADEKGNRQWRLYLRDYCYPAGDLTPHKCKIRASAMLTTEELLKLPHFLADEAGDPPLTKFNLGYLFDRLEEIRLTTLARAATEFPDAPGMKPSTIGAAPPAARVMASAPAGLTRVGAPQLSPSSTVTKVVAQASPVTVTAPAGLLPSQPTKEEPGVVATVAAPPMVAVTTAPPQPAVQVAAPLSLPPAPPPPVAGAASDIDARGRQVLERDAAGKPLVVAKPPAAGLRPPPPGMRPIQRAPVAAAPAAPPPGRVLPKKPA